MAAQVAVCDVLMEAGVAATEIAVTVIGAEEGVILIDAEPDFEASCVEVALQVPVPVADGVNTPACVMVPPVAVQVTALLKLPCPETVAVQVAVCPKTIAVGAAATATVVIVLPAPLTATVPAPDLLLSCVDTAVMVSSPLVGAVAGAV